MSGDRIAIVIESVENVRLDPQAEYYVRVTIGHLKLGSQYEKVDGRSLRYNTHTTLPHDCVGQPILSVDLVDKHDLVIATRQINNWPRFLEATHKGILVASLYKPGNPLAALDSPIHTAPGHHPDGLPGREGHPPESDHEITRRNECVGTVRIKIYLGPTYAMLKRSYDRLDVYVAKIVEVCGHEMSERSPHVILKLGDKCVDMPAGRAAGRKDEWLWEEPFAFQYDGESELYISVRDPTSDRELGKAILFISQLAYNVRKVEASSVASVSTPQHDRRRAMKLAGNMPVTDELGVHIGRIVIGAELWNEKTVMERSMSDPRRLSRIEKRIEIDESLLNDLSQIPETDKIHIGGQLAECKNSLEKVKLDRQILMSAGGAPPPPPPPVADGSGIPHPPPTPHSPVLDKRSIKKLFVDENLRCDEIEKELHRAETHLFGKCCDMARDLDKDVAANCQSSQNLIKRCQLDLHSSPKMLQTTDNTIAQMTDEINTLVRDSKACKNKIYQIPALDNVPTQMGIMKQLHQRSLGIQLDLQKLNEQIRFQSEQARENERMRTLQVQLIESPPPNIVQRGPGLASCFSCCQGPSRDSRIQQLEIGKPETLRAA